MSEAQLNVLNYALLALIYLFFARVLWAVWSEVRGPRAGNPRPQVAVPRAAGDPTMGAPTSARPARPTKSGKRPAPTKLVVLQPRVRKGAAYPLAGEVTLGRAGSCSIGLPDDTFASQLHARLVTRDGAVVLEDLGSTNGTYLNGGRVGTPVTVAKGDRVQVGNTIFEAQ